MPFKDEMTNLMMRTFERARWAGLWLVMFAGAVHANELRFGRLTIEDGLSQNSVMAIGQDSQGFMWFGATDGLNRFDGYDFKQFHHDASDTGSLAGNYVNVIFEDSQGVLWIGTQGAGLSRYDGASQRFDSFSHDPKRHPFFEPQRCTGHYRGCVR